MYGRELAAVFSECQQIQRNPRIPHLRTRPLL